MKPEKLKAACPIHRGFIAMGGMYNVRCEASVVAVDFAVAVVDFRREQGPSGP